ncbi:uncharacterized protein LOC104899176 [Beta vulgaris subsp. vulgaris]|uniref:uncharacterized protein LOC104899176 n=1 Tax=Beta vulgaris subsp. vulgaris TaxID=3555 RepID=UPI00053F3E92|nr:uncharacterized protein LOC104899176 [Beta vulgaris subsp. vulgaris]
MAPTKNTRGKQASNQVPRPKRGHSPPHNREAEQIPSPGRRSPTVQTLDPRSASQQIQNVEPQPLFAADIALITAQLQETFQKGMMDMMAMLQQRQHQLIPLNQPEHRERTIVRSQRDQRDVHSRSNRDQQPSRPRSDARDPSHREKEKSARQGSARQHAETHVSKSPRGGAGRKPQDARDFLNKKRLSQGYDAREFLNKKAHNREGHGDSAHSQPPKLTGVGLKFLIPFSQEILGTPTPGKIKTPLIEPFAGLTDPDDHMASYKAQMSVQTSCEATWCHFFPTTLKGRALNWFQELPAGVITDFAILEHLFIHQFVAGKRQRKTSLHLMGVMQDKNEPLADYIKRFNEESLKITDLQDAVAFAALMSGLQPGRLRWSLAENEVKTFSEAMPRAQRFIQATDICRHSDEWGKKRKDEGNHRDQPKYQRTGGRGDRLTDNGNDPRFNKNRKEIYFDIRNKNWLPKPAPIRTSSSRRNKSLWCDYHKECGHTTKDCRELKKSLDGLADQGKLNHYLKHSTKEKGKQKVGQSNSGDTEGFIGVIAGGFASGGLTGRARKAHLQNKPQASSARCPATPTQLPGHDLWGTQSDVTYAT